MDTTETVVVVDDTPSAEPVEVIDVIEVPAAEAPPVVVEAAPPQYVTAGELDARLALHRQEIEQSLSHVHERAAEAVTTADNAADTAAAAVEAAETAVEVAVAADPTEDMPEAAEEPARRSVPAPAPETAGASDTGKGSGRKYGNPAWYGG